MLSQHAPRRRPCSTAGACRARSKPPPAASPPASYTNYKENVKKQQKAVKDLVKANVAVETAAKNMRGRPRKNATIPAMAVVEAASVPAIKRFKRTRTRLTTEQKALKEQEKAN